MGGTNGAVSAVGHGKPVFAQFGRLWWNVLRGRLVIIYSVTIVVELIGAEQSLSFFGIPSF